MSDRTFWRLTGWVCVAIACLAAYACYVSVGSDW
jgi:hypothetical protein